ncbi:MAG TPA: ArsR family transcriptional regulator [Bdellovibrionales bacterium]|nr:transcriptional regulator [Pseudobdellovibrionaceae bacterium]HAG90473.1 ArsR family transcriptional regulator [Bdellovibrionales bacterium]|tara:strand:- start:4916 stop:5287 length:372 start_codon:yes stop_codon:yes gene_type:complete
MPKRKQKKMTQTKTIYDLQAEICSALANPVRLHILDLLAEGEKTSTDLLEVLEIPKANLSQHLSVLKDAGIIQSRKEGLYHYMSLAIPKIKDACSLVRSVLAEKIVLEEKKNSELIRELKAQR